MSEYITMRDCLKLDLSDAIAQRDEARAAFAIATSNCVDAQQRLREMEDQRNFAMGEMERLKRERDEARHTASALNRRLTKAEGIIEAADLVENRPTKGGGGLGRALANYSADKYMRERDEARKLAESAMLEADRLRSQLWRARDRAWQIACERSRLKSQISNLQSP